MRRFSHLALLALCILPTAVFAQPTDDFARARVVEITEEYEDEVAGYDRLVQAALLEIVSGYETGKTFTVENGALAGRDDLRLHVGEIVIVEKVTRIDGSVVYAVRDKYRLPAIGYLTLVFIVLAIVLGGRTGISAFVGLLASVFLLIVFIVPAIVRGADPLTTSLFGAIAIACTSLYLAHGFNRRTTVALLSTVITLVVSAVLAIAFVHFAKLFGMGSEEAMFLQSGPYADVNLRGLLLGGIIIGALGVLDDITTAQTAAVHEISRADPSLTPAELRQRGISVGKEHIASLINTLALAYVGSSLPLLLLFTVNSGFPLWVTINGEFMAEEIIRTLVGSATLLIAVPVSTSLASVLMRGAPAVHGGHGHSHHH